MTALQRQQGSTPGRLVATPPIAISCNLRDLRGDRSLNDLQHVTGIHRGTLSRIERGMQFPSGEQAARITSAYGGKIVYLLQFIVGDGA